MPAKDIYHNAVVQSLRADGWIITHDPLYIAYGGRNLFVDLGAEREAIAAEKDGQKIAQDLRIVTIYSRGECQESPYTWWFKRKFA